VSDNNDVIGEYAAVLSRRKWHFLVPAILIAMAAAALAFSLPAIYRSTATLLIERQEIPSQMVASTVTGHAVEQIQTINQQVMTFDNLKQIAADYGLAPEGEGPDSDDEAVKQIKERITVEMLREDIVNPRTGRPTEVTTGFSISFDNEVPEVAQQVASRLAELYLQENRKTRTRSAASTSAFLAAEADRLNARIATYEAKIADFKREHPDLLPEATGRVRETLQRSEQKYEELTASVRLLESRKALLEGQLASLDDGYEQRLNGLRTELAAARERFSDIHPDVQRLKRALTQLEAERKSGLKPQLPNADSGQAYAARISLQSDLQTVVAQLSGERMRLKELAKDIERYEEQLKRAPAAEQEYLALKRDYDNAVLKYREMKDKEMQATLSEELEKEQKGERLSLLEAPRLPVDPVKPNRLGILLLGIMLALMGGTGVAAIAEFTDNTIHGVRELAAILRTQPIGVIPVIEAGEAAGR
jgi:succinoglycan biosynthesis transport protein ExoP